MENTAPPMDRMANWCSHGGWFMLALSMKAQRPCILICFVNHGYTGDCQAMTNHYIVHPSSHTQENRLMTVV
jgi:hypothetical protein